MYANSLGQSRTNGVYSLEGELMATAKPPARKTPAKVKVEEKVRLPTLVELHEQLGEKDADVKAAKAALKAAKDVRNLVRIAIAEKIDAELRKQKKAKPAKK